jgi:putative transposase
LRYPFCMIRIVTMPVPIACPVALTPEEHARLESLVRAHSTPQALAFRCRLILRTAASDRPSNLQVATEMACERHTVGRWRQRYLAYGLHGLQDAPRSGRPRRVSPL